MVTTEGRAKGFAIALAAGVDRHTLETISYYIEKGIPTGGFLRAVLENDLCGACGRADHDNQRALYDIVSFLYNYAPSDCWGSPKNVQEWLAKAAREREAHARKNDESKLGVDVEEPPSHPELGGCGGFRGAQ